MKRYGNIYSKICEMSNGKELVKLWNEWWKLWEKVKTYVWLNDVVLIAIYDE